MKIVVPTLPESEDSAVISTLYVQEGETVSEGQILLEVETSKVVLEVSAVASGVISGLMVSQGDYVNSEQVLMDLNGGDVSAYEESETIEVDPESFILEEEIGDSSTKNESSSFGLWMVGLVTLIFIISIAAKGL
jgi:2-oxoglutarate dehydrogenase E2 component (dihydrolipoamide succinyltransferase)